MSALLPLAGGGHVEIQRASASSTFHTPAPLGTEELLHPYLSSTASMVARWRGWQCLHSGGLIIDGRGALGVVGAKGTGKSTFLAAATQAELGVLTDDVLVVDSEGFALAGPRCLDLRRTASEALGLGESVGTIGARARYRMQLEESPSRVPLAGWILLEWGPDIEVVRLSHAETLGAMVSNLALRIAPPDPPRLLELCGLPAWRVRRPSSFNLLGAGLEALLNELHRTVA